MIQKSPKQDSNGNSLSIVTDKHQLTPREGKELYFMESIYEPYELICPNVKKMFSFSKHLDDFFSKEEIGVLCFIEAKKLDSPLFNYPFHCKKVLQIVGTRNSRIINYFSSFSIDRSILDLPFNTFLACLKQIDMVNRRNGITV